MTPTLQIARSVANRLSEQRRDVLDRETGAHGAVTKSMPGLQWRAYVRMPSTDRAVTFEGFGTTAGDALDALCRLLEEA